MLIRPVLLTPDGNFGRLPLLCLLFTFRLGEFASVVNLGLPSWAGVINYNLANALQTLVIVEFVFSFLSLPVPKFLRLVEIVGALPILNISLLAPVL